ncbi:ABC transporter ATP-binding protein [Jidongwangia harbinensis]|uniref:ABC transporter ATP-binding protein n=1 Tax=Jidongwangia harbinensis TaxID=2878561 RepID=UPI001CD945B3|nr:ABC transporter ATP-binding protein [Jidongwangia harbinensis]MCA2219059.1 ABC transporter ATP-binding protein [Jidongwangia harbinensis]
MAIIEVTNFRKVYGSTVAADDVTFSVEEGEIFGILGPNGAGKSTTVEAIAGLRKPDGGKIVVLGRDPGDPSLRKEVGVQLQESELPEKMTVREALELFSTFYPKPADWRQLAAELGIDAKLNARFGKLSGGQKQRLSIALALIGDPEIAILDELTTGLDPSARRDTWDLIESVRNRGVTVLLVTHFMEEAERLCDRIAVIDRGRVVALDTPQGLIAQVSTEQRIRFRPSEPLDDALLTGLAEVREVRHHGPTVEVIGVGDVLQAVTSVLAVNNIIAAELRVEQANLDDAFVQLTDRKLAANGSDN